MGELWFEGVAVWGSSGLKELRCGGVAVWWSRGAGSGDVRKLQCGVVALWESGILGQTHCVGVTMVNKP